MAAVLYRCPTVKVQAWLADDPPSDGDTFEVVTCPACTQAHLVNREGKAIGNEDE
jgi:hypothetical protein